MDTSERCCLKWSDHKENTSSVFGSLREDSEFSDVTLVCEDGTQVEVHKVILASSSIFFQHLLRRNQHSHPIIYMRGVKLEDLMAIVDYIYLGETNIHQDNLNIFLKIAEELSLKGLTKRYIDKQANVIEENADTKLDVKDEYFQENTYQGLDPLRKSETIEDALKFCETKSQEPAHSERAEQIVNVLELDEQIKSMMTIGKTMRKDGKQKNTRCTVCGKESKYSHIKSHIKTTHMDGISFPCNLCERSCRSRAQLSHHKQRVHN